MLSSLSNVEDVEVEAVTNGSVTATQEDEAVFETTYSGNTKVRILGALTPDFF